MSHSHWEAVTLHHVLRDAGGPRQEGLSHQVPCPRCDRLRVPADILVVAPLPAAITGGATYACSACWQTWYRSMGAEAFIRALGAPQENIDRAAARECRRAERAGAQWQALRRAFGAPKPSFN